MRQATQAQFQPEFDARHGALQGVKTASCQLRRELRPALQLGQPQSGKAGLS
jgi:hypothetical protein